MDLSIVVRPLYKINGTKFIRRSGRISTAFLSSYTDARSFLENKDMENIHKKVADFPFSVSTKQSVLSQAGVWKSSGGADIADIMTKALTPNNWRYNSPLWNKWSLVCEVDIIDPIQAD